MHRNIFLANRLREVLLNGHWIANTNYKAQLQDVTWQQAIKKPGNLNSIAALTFHINYYLKGLLHAFNCGELNISDKYSFNLPEINNKTEWEALVSDFLNNSQKFIHVVEQITESQLNQPFIDKKYGTVLRNIEAVIEHGYYHLGQLVLVKKLLTEAKPPL